MRHAANKYTLGIEIIFNPKKVLQNQNPLPLFILYPGIKSNTTTNFIYWYTHLKKKIFFFVVNMISLAKYHIYLVCVKMVQTWKNLDEKVKNLVKKLTQFFNLLRWSTQYLCWASVLQLAVRWLLNSSWFSTWIFRMNQSIVFFLNAVSHTQVYVLTSIILYRDFYKLF